MTDKKTFGSFIKERRSEKGYSQKDLAEMLFVTEGAVSKWERGVSYPDITLIADICRALDISEHELITASTDTDTKKMKLEARKFRTIRSVWFWTPTITYAAAALICLICNLAVNHTVSWFFIVLSALICAYSFVPTFSLFVESKKLLVFAVTTYLSVCLLLFTCAVYTGALYWFLTAAIGVAMGYVLVFVPIFLSKTAYARCKFLSSFLITFALTILLELSVYTFRHFLFLPAVMMTAYGFLPFVLSAVVCTFRMDGFYKAAICTTVISAMLYSANWMIALLFGLSGNHYRVDFNDWANCLNGNINFLSLLSMLFIAAIFAVIGTIRTRKRQAR